MSGASSISHEQTRQASDEQEEEKHPESLHDVERHRGQGRLCSDVADSRLAPAVREHPTPRHET